LLAIGLLAVGLSGNLALGTALDAILFRQAPVREPSRLVRIVRTDDQYSTYDNWSFPTADDLRRESTTLSDAAIFVDWRNVQLTLGRGDGMRLQGGIATGNYFALLGVRPALGRLFAEGDDDARSPSPVVVLSDGLWRERFGADPTVIGRDVRLNGQRFGIIGVAPRGFASLDPALAPRLWVPITAWASLLADESRTELLAQRGSSWLDIVARLAPGATVESAQAEIDARLTALAAEFPDELTVEAAGGLRNARAWVVPVDVARVGGPAEAPRVERRAALVATFGLVVLLVVAANLAALLAARAAQTRHETALRAALGATRVQRALPQMAEGVLLAGCGLALAWPLTTAASRIAARSLGFVLPLASGSPMGASSSPWFAFFAALLVVLTILLVAGGPALAASGTDAMRTLRLGTARPPGRRGAASDLLLAVQVALSMVLLVLAVLLVGRWRDLSRAEIGFRPTNVVQASVDIGLQRYSAPRAVEFERQLLAGARRELGEESVALTDWTPLAGGWSRTTIDPQGYVAAPGESPTGDVAWVSPELFSVLSIRLQRGRLFDDHDDADSPPVAIINSTLARRYFAGRDPLGATFSIGRRTPEARPILVVGVVEDARFRDLSGDVPAMFFRPLDQSPSPRLRVTVVARSATPAAALARMRELLRRLDPELPIYRAGALDDQVGAALADDRRAASLFSGFAALVLLIAAAGLGALTLAAVARRKREIGVRVALGAGSGSILALLIRRIAALVAVGAGIGLAVSAALLPRIGGLAGDSTALDATHVVIALSALTIAAAVATWLPARRALAIEPAEILRAE